MTDDDAERAGRMIAGHTSYEQTIQETRTKNQRSDTDSVPRFTRIL